PLDSGELVTLPRSSGRLLADFLTPTVQRIALLGVDFPVASTTPGFTYVWDPETGTPTRMISLGPVFAERARTIGQGRLEVGAFFLYANLDEFKGGGFGYTSRGSSLKDGKQICDSVQITSFNLRQTSLDLSATYGLSGNWDVNLLLPVLH